MSYEHDIFVYRPLLPESEAALKRLQKEYASIRSFNAPKNLHLTIFKGHTKKRLRAKLQRIASNAPAISQNTYDAEVESAQMLRSLPITRLAIRLMLNVPSDDPYYEELEAFADVAKKVDPTMWARHFVEPHITLGYIDVGDGVASLMDSAQALAGTTLHFGRSTSNVGPVSVRMPVVKQPTVSTSMHIDTPVRTIQPGGIPAGFLASLRSQSPSE